MRLVAIVVASMLVVARASLAVDIDTCGVTIAPGDTGRLIADLDCSTGSGICIYPAFGIGDVACTDDADCPENLPPGFRYCVKEAVHLSSRATLDMNGHVVTGAGIVCGGGGCVLIGPGEVVGAAAALFAVRGSIKASDVTLRDGEYGIFWRLGRLTLTNLQITNNEESGIETIVASIRAANVTSSDGGGYGFHARTIKGTDLTANGNGDTGIFANRRVKVKGLTVQNNSYAGVRSDRMRLEDGVITGNGLGPNGTGLDVLSTRPPKLTNVICDAGSHPGSCTN